MAVEEVDELATLMPRTKAANDRARVDPNSLKQYMQVTRPAPKNAARKHKDTHGFQDIDEFWAENDDGSDDDDDDDDFEDLDDDLDGDVNDEVDDDDDSSTQEQSQRIAQRTSANERKSIDRRTHRASSTASATPAAASVDDYDFENNDNDEHVNLSTDTMDLDDALGTERTAAATLQTPKPTHNTPVQRTPPPLFSARSNASSSSPAPSRDRDMSTSFDTGSAMKAIPIPTRRATLDADVIQAKRLIARKSLQGQAAAEALDATNSKRKRDAIHDATTGFDAGSSPFSIGDDPLSPLVSTEPRYLSYVSLDAANAPNDPNDDYDFADGNDDVAVDNDADRSSDASPSVRKALFPSSDDAVTSKHKHKSSTHSPRNAAAAAGDAAGDTDNATAARQAKKKKKPTRLALPKTKKQAAIAKAKRLHDTKSNKSDDTLQTGNDASLHAPTTTDDDDSDAAGGDDSSSRPLHVTARANARDLFATNAPSDDDDDDANDASGARRSKRRRFKPLAWYKGEHYIYERRSSGVGLVIPTVAGIERVGTMTPTKTARTYTKRATAAAAGKGRPSQRMKPFPKSQLPPDLTFETGEWAELYDVAAGCVNKMNVLCRATEIEHRALPAVDDEPHGFAGQSFNLRSAHPFARWICGRLALPPGAAKEAESVDSAVQVFYVTQCQPQAVEVAFGPVTGDFFDLPGATRFLLNPGDEFYVPAKNAYYLKNYSTTTTCDLHFMIMKPDVSSSSSSGTKPQQASSGSASSSGDSDSVSASDSDDDEPIAAVAEQQKAATKGKPTTKAKRPNRKA